MDEDNPEGVWCIYFHDTSPVVRFVDRNLDRLVLRMDSGDQLLFWPYNMHFNDAIKRWEERQRGLQ